MGGERFVKGRFAVFWDHKSLFQKEMKAEYNPKLGHSCEDHIIRNRSEKQQVSLQRALSGMQALYFHQSTMGLMFKAVPTDASNSTPYDARGWPLLESSALALSGKLQLLQEDGSSLYCFKRIGQSAPLLPLTDFKSNLDGREFSGKADRDVVLKAYQEGLQQYQLRAQKMYIQIDVDNILEQQQMATVLQGCSSLQELAVRCGVLAQQSLESCLGVAPSKVLEALLHADLKKVFGHLRARGVIITFCASPDC